MKSTRVKQLETQMNSKNLGKTIKFHWTASIIPILAALRIRPAVQQSLSNKNYLQHTPVWESETEQRLGRLGQDEPTPPPSPFQLSMSTKL